MYRFKTNAFYKITVSVLALFIAVTILMPTSGAASAAAPSNSPASSAKADVPLCGTGQVPMTEFYDNLEAGSANWVMAANPSLKRWQYDSPYGINAHSGVHFLYADDYPDAVSNAIALLKNGIRIPAGAYLYFAHAYKFEAPAYDGGVLEYKIDGDNTWYDAGKLFTNNGYVGVISPDTGNPLSGRPAFVGDSQGYITSRVNLAPLAGLVVYFRWRMGLDNDGYAGGWWLDDVQIYSCKNPASGFNTSFNTTHDNWITRRGSWSHLFSTYYTTVGLANQFSSISYNVNFSNFTYEVRLRRAGCASCSNYVSVRGTPLPLDTAGRWHQEYKFAYSNDGAFSIWKVDGGTVTEIKKWTTNINIVQNGWNILKVTASGGTLKFYVNGVLFWSGSGSAFSTGQVGIGMYRDALSERNRFNVDWATLTAVTTAMDESTPLATGTVLEGDDTGHR